MRTNIDIDDDVLDAAMRAGGFKTKKDAVEAGLKLLARQAAYRDILRFEGKLRWDGDEDVAPDSLAGGAPGGSVLRVQELAASALVAPARRPAGKSATPVRKQAKTGHARR